MKKTTQKMYAVLLTFVMLCGCLIIPTPATVEAAGNTKLRVTSAKTVVVGKTIKIKTNVKAKFKSSNKKIATVSSKGVVKGKKAGKVKITVTSKSNKKQKKVIKITVKKKPNTTVTTEKPTPSPNPKPTTEAPSTKPTTQAPTTQSPTTEKKTTEEATTEKGTTEKPTTEAPTPAEKPYLYAEYPGGIVARNKFHKDDEDGSFYIDKYCLDIYLVNGNAKTQISPSFVTASNCTSKIINNVTYYTCTLTYEDYSYEYTFQVTDQEIETDILDMSASISEEISDTLPNFNQLEFYFLYENGKFEKADKINLNSNMCTILKDKNSIFIRYDFEYTYNDTTVILPFYAWVYTN